MRVLFWFRKGLRLHDNPTLLEALSRNPKAIIPIFCLDPSFVCQARVGIRRWIFLLETLQDLNQSLGRVGSRLLVLRGRPELLFPILFKEWNIDALYYESDTEPFALKRDAKINELAKEFGVQVVASHGHTLYIPEQVIAINKGKTPLTYQAFLKIVHQWHIPEALPSPKDLPPCPTLSLKEHPPTVPKEWLEEITSDSIDINSRLKLFSSFGQECNFSVPSIEDLGFQPLNSEDMSPHHGGETVALKLMDAYIKDKKKVAYFEKPQTSPAAFDPADTTVLSPHLKFGSLSCRLFYHCIQSIYKEFKNHSQPPVSLVGQLLWREFFYTVAYATPNFHKMRGNPVCLQIDWKSDDQSIEHLNAWTNGQTGFPWIDAIMIQLRREGWIHHLARHSVACFLTRGDLYISWEKGAQVFEELLLDADYALNSGNWLWLSASAFFTQYFRVYSPIAFGKKYDKEGKFIKKYIPKLRKMPLKYLFEPWTAPLSIQQTAGCIIGKDYPLPIILHEIESKSNMEKMKFAYKRGQRGMSDFKLIDEQGDIVDEKFDLKHAMSQDSNPSNKKLRR